jgi:tRNA (guanine-N7-)-methyltransferase
MRQRQHVNPLGLSFETYRDVIPELDPSRPVEVEVGCAEAKFLFERAARVPEGQYLGLEIRDWLVDQVNEQARAQEVPVQALFCHANHHLRTVVPEGRADRVHVLFPDPWFKKRQRKRRVVDNGLAVDIHAVLRPGGELHFASDVWSVALDALEVFERHDHLFENRVGPWSFWKRENPYGAQSWRESHCQAEGMPVWRMIYRRREISAE